MIKEEKINIISRYNTDLRKFDVARVYGKKCIIAGKESGMLHWVINVSVLLAKLHIAEKNKFDAINQIKDAQLIAQQLQDNTIQEYLIRCQDVIDQLAFDDVVEEKMVRKRQNKILEMVRDHHLKEEFSTLFRAMSAAPQHRRMSIMPGAKLKEDKKTYSRYSVFPGTKGKTPIAIDERDYSLS